MPVAHILLPDSCSTFQFQFTLLQMINVPMMTMMMMMMASARLSFQNFPLINMAIFMIINYKVFTANFAGSLLRCKLFPSAHQRNYSVTDSEATARQTDS